MNLTELQLTAFMGMIVMLGIYIWFQHRERRIKKSADESVDRWNKRVQEEWDKWPSKDLLYKQGQTVCKHGNPIERCEICEKE